MGAKKFILKKFMCFFGPLKETETETEVRRLPDYSSNLCLPKTFAIYDIFFVRGVLALNQVDGKGGLGLRGVAFMTVLAVLAVLAVLKSTLPSFCLSYKIQCQETTVTVLTVLAVLAVVTVPVVTTTPLKLNPPFP